MIRYKLLEDLPTYKAGWLFKLDINDNLVCAEEHEDCSYTAYTSDELDAHPEILTEWFEEVEDDSEWPEDNDDYFYIDGHGQIQGWLFQDPYDRQCRDIGNCYKTKEEAQKAFEWFKARAILKRDTNGYKWSSGKPYIEVYYDDDLKKLEVDDETHGFITHNLLFETIEDAEVSVKNHEKEWKIYLGVSDD